MTPRRRFGLALLLALLGLLLVVLDRSPTAARGQETAVPPDTAPASRPAREQGTIPTTSLMQILNNGGLLMYPILACSIISVVFLFERTISLRRGRVVPDPFVKRFLHQLREGQLTRDEALELCEQNASPVATVFAGAVRKWGKPSVEVEQALIDTGERVTNDLRRYLRVFNGVATVSPLLGLLGTVFGMIAAFNAIATSQALGRPELLATGISQALLTTAFGLAVAIPALICYWIFISLVDRRVIEIDALGQELVGLIAGDCQTEAAKPARSRRRDAVSETAAR